MALPQLVGLQSTSGDIVSALHSFKQMFAVWQRSSDLMFAVVAIGNLIGLFARSGNLLSAAHLSGALVGLAAMDYSFSDLPGTLMLLQREFGEATFDEESRRGAPMSLGHAWQYAIEQIDQAELAIRASRT